MTARRTTLATLMALALLLLPSAVQAACTRRFAWTEWEPFHYRGIDGEMHGIDHALVGDAARRAGCTVLWVEMPRSRALPLLKDGRIDGIAGMSRTQEREVFALYAGPMRPGRNVLTVRRGDAATFPFTSLRELADSGFRLGIIGGAKYSQEYESLLASGALADNVVQVANTEGAVTMLLRGRIDGYIDGQIVARRQHARMEVSDRVEEHPMVISNTAAYLLLSRRSVDPAVAERFNTALRAMMADGSIERVMTSGLMAGLGAQQAARTPAE